MIFKCSVLRIQGMIRSKWTYTGSGNRLAPNRRKSVLEQKSHRNRYTTSGLLQPRYCFTPRSPFVLHRITTSTPYPLLHNAINTEYMMRQKSEVETLWNDLMEMSNEYNWLLFSEVYLIKRALCSRVSKRIPLACHINNGIANPITWEVKAANVAMIECISNTIYDWCIILGCLLLRQITVCCYEMHYTTVHTNISNEVFVPHLWQILDS